MANKLPLHYWAIFLSLTLSCHGGEIKRQNIIGKWLLDVRIGDVSARGTTEYLKNGVVRSSGKFEFGGQVIFFKAEGKWKLQGHKLIWELTKTSHPEILPVGEKTTEIILELTKTTLKYRDDEGDIFVEKRVAEK